MSNLPANLKYTKDHEWLRDLGGGLVLTGITDYAQTSLGDVTFVELPALGKTFQTGQTMGVVESVKAASDIYAPVSGEIVEINTVLENEPGLVNREPYGQGWMAKIKMTQPDELNRLLDMEAYARLI